MEQAGATPVEVFRQAISDGVPRIHVICMMRDVCNLGLRETTEVVREAESRTPRLTPAGRLGAEYYDWDEVQTYQPLRVDNSSCDRRSRVGFSTMEDSALHFGQNTHTMVISVD